MILTNEILVVDLDGTLLMSDMLHESFWSAFSRNWRSPFSSVAALGRGKATLKSYLRTEAEIDVTSLPYNETVIEYIRAHRAQGGRTALVTASNQAFASDIAEYLQIFDEVHGSDPSLNLKGSNKATFLVDRFGDVGFCYMGDSAADLPVWQVANKIITVNASPSLRQKTERINKPIKHLATTAKSLRPHIKALRSHHWMKNFLIFLPMLAGHQFDAATVFSSILAFIVFNLVASSAYVLNDLLDLNADRAHPRKRLRPFASGAVPIAQGSVLVLSLFVVGILIAVLVGGKFLLTVVAYWILTTAYSLKLKRKIIIDICVLAGLYTIRIQAGGFATGIELSIWLLAFSLFFFFSLASLKRQVELVDMIKRDTLSANGRGYNATDLPIITIVSLTAGYISVLVLALYINSAAVGELYNVPSILWGICCVLLYWLTRMVMLTHRGIMYDDLVEFVAKDRVSHVSFFIILAFAIAGNVL